MTYGVETSAIAERSLWAIPRAACDVCVREKHLLVTSKAARWFWCPRSSRSRLRQLVERLPEFRDIVQTLGRLHASDPAETVAGQLEVIGLSLAEARELLARVQEHVVGAQTAAFVAGHRHCDACGRRLWSKGRTSFKFRSPFGDVPVTGPRLKSCPCQAATCGTFTPLTGLFTEHVSPEMLYLETKWASLVPFGVTVELLKDVLPVGNTLNAQTVRNHLQRVATRMEGELGQERTSWAEDGSPDPAQLPLPEGPIVVGIDGGYVRACEPDRMRREANFEVVVGQSIAEDRDSRYFGLVQSFDDRPKRRLHDVLREQGLQMNQDITFLTDGGDTVRNLAAEMSPCAEHVLDWFHITMRLAETAEQVIAMHRPAWKPIAPPAR